MSLIKLKPLSEVLSNPKRAELMAELRRAQRAAAEASVIRGPVTPAARAEAAAAAEAALRRCAALERAIKRT
jgi:hypothetical protein